MMPRKPRRRGFAMVLVLVFVTLILGSWAVATRHTGSMIRVEQARTTRVRRDVARLPALSALALALAALEAGYPPEAPFACAVLASDGTRHAASFSRDPDDPAAWTVSVAPDADASLPLLGVTPFGIAPPGPSN